MWQTFPISICLNTQQSEPLYISISLKLSSTEWQIAGIVTDVVLNVVKQRCTMRGGTKTLSNMRSVLVSNLFCFRVTGASHYSGSPMTVIVSSHRFVHCQIVKLSSLCQVSAVSMSTNRLVTRQQRSCHLWLLSKALNQNICISCLHMPIL